MNKTDLIDRLAAPLDGNKKSARIAVESIVDAIQREVQKGRKVSIAGFGVFEKRQRAARTARNPRTGEVVKVKKTTVPAFRPGKYFKDVIAGTVKLPKPTGEPIPGRCRSREDGRSDRHGKADHQSSPGRCDDTKGRQHHRPSDPGRRQDTNSHRTHPGQVDGNEEHRRNGNQGSHQQGAPPRSRDGQGAHNSRQEAGRPAGSRHRTSRRSAALTDITSD